MNRFWPSSIEGDFVAAERRCHEMLQIAGTAAKMAPIRTVAKFMLALSQLQHQPEESLALYDGMLVEVRMLAKRRPDKFSLLYSWVLLQKSNRNHDDIEEADNHAKTAIDLSFHDYLLAFGHHILALASSAPDSNSKAIRLQRRAIEMMPKYQLFLRAVLEQQMVELLESANRTSEARKFLEKAVKWREQIVPADNIYIADARVRLGKHLIEHADSESEFRLAETLLLQQQSEMENRPSGDVFRLRWHSQMINLYDSWKKPHKQFKWKNALQNGSSAL